MPVRLVGNKGIRSLDKTPISHIPLFPTHPQKVIGDLFSLFTQSFDVCPCVILGRVVVKEFSLSCYIGDCASSS